MHSENQNRGALHLAGSFTLDPLEGPLSFWWQVLGLGIKTLLAPYGQLIPAFLGATDSNQGSSLRAKVAVVRLADLAFAERPARKGMQLEEIIGAVAAQADGLPKLILVAPISNEEADQFGGVSNARNWVLRGTEDADRRRSITVLFADDECARLEVNAIHDPVAARSAHIPFTDSAYTAMATSIARWIWCLTARPTKVIAVDCDHTLWRGVLGECAPEEIELRAEHQALQRALVQQVAKGRLVCLVTKNDASDVQRLFESRADFPLKLASIAAIEASWDDKVNALTRLSSSLGLSLNTFAFIDDSPIECARVTASLPAIATIQFPADSIAAERFADHLWLFDGGATTAEDGVRTQKYQQNAERDRAMGGATSLLEFFATLGLEVRIESATDEHVTRLAQLSIRTNQFNVSLTRQSPVDVAAWLEDQSRSTFSVRASDRFGDYGTVGYLSVREEEECVHVDQFLLSCRALGRGIEHEMARTVAGMFANKPETRIRIHYRAGERNAPARRFLGQLGFHATSIDEDFTTTAGDLASTQFDPTGALDTAALPDENASARADGVVLDGVSATTCALERIAKSLNSIDRIQSAIKVASVGSATEDVVALPTGGFTDFIEQTVAEVWSVVLGVARVGPSDKFADIGGTSLKLVRVHAELVRRLSIQIELIDLFGQNTVSAVADLLRGRSREVRVASTANRARLIRAATSSKGATFSRKPRPGVR